MNGGDGGMGGMEEWRDWRNGGDGGMPVLEEKKGFRVQERMKMHDTVNMEMQKESLAR
jgi:hypothetical protein